MDYAKTPAEDFATGMITHKNPETGQKVKSQFTNSWIFEKQGLRLFMDGMGPGYAFEINTLISPLSVFIGDVAAEAIKDAESALDKATASHGLLTVQHNEAVLYGYTDENADALAPMFPARILASRFLHSSLCKSPPSIASIGIRKHFGALRGFNSSRG